MSPRLIYLPFLIFFRDSNTNSSQCLVEQEQENVKTDVLCCRVEETILIHSSSFRIAVIKGKFLSSL